MSQAFLFTSWNCDHDVAAYLPFEPRKHIVEKFGEARLQTWPLRDDLDSTNGHVTDGWIDAPSSRPADASVAAVQHQIRTYAGEFASLTVDPSGHVVAWCDFLGGRHIYYRYDGRRLAVSNRAMLAAAAFGTPEIEPIEMSWFMASIACPFTENTAWRGVKILEAGGVLRWNGRLETHRTEIEPATSSWDALWEELCHRVEHLTGHPSSRMALTGGLDSRLVLAAAIGSGTVPRLEHAYLRGSEQLADVKVGRALADEYDLNFRLEPFVEVTEDVETVIDRHNFQTEHGLHCWDLKGLRVAPDARSLHGNYGEIFRSHSLPRFVLGWMEVRRKYFSDKYLDLYDVMTPDAVAHVRRGTKAWVEQKKADGVTPLNLHDRMHRAARMHRWVGHTSQVDGFLGGSVNPIPSPRLLSNYLALPLLEQKVNRTHFELLRRADDWLWRQPFAGWNWSRLIAPLQRPKPVQSGPGATSRQIAFWQRNSRDLVDLISTPDSTDFDALFDPQRVARLITQTEQNPTPYRVRALLGLAGVRRSLAAPAQRHICTVEDNHEPVRTVDRRPSVRHRAGVRSPA